MIDRQNKENIINRNSLTGNDKNKGKMNLFPQKRNFGKDITNNPKSKAIQFPKKLLPVSVNPQEVPEYVDEIFANLKLTENVNSPKYDIIKRNQSEVSQCKRMVILNWITHVHFRFELLPETFYLTVNIIDRYLEKNPNFQLKDLQLLSLSAMLIASKYEEIYAPEVNDFVWISNKSVTFNDIIKMESKILYKLNFEMLIVSPYIFLVRLNEVSGGTNQTLFLAQMLLEIGLSNYDFCSVNSSLKASTVLFLSRRVILGKEAHNWTPTLKLYSGYDEKQIKACSRSIHDAMVVFAKKIKENKPPFILNKYRTNQFNKVADLVFP